jgi:osmotically-inducible protein OsmY
MRPDAQLQRDVLEELNWEPSIDDAAQIAVTAHEGVVTLTGIVPAFSQKWLAERTAKRVHGVKAVANDIEVGHPNGPRTDTDIANAVVHALQWDSLVPDERLRCTIRNGWVTLEGTVEWQYQKEAAENAIRNILGIRHIANDIIVQPRVTAAIVKEKIEAAFRRSAEVDARDIEVDAAQGRVTLRGVVHSWTERDEAERAAWSAAGVSDVDNRLLVT